MVLITASCGGDAASSTPSAPPSTVVAEVAGVALTACMTDLQTAGFSAEDGGAYLQPAKDSSHPALEVKELRSGTVNYEKISDADKARDVEMEAEVDVSFLERVQSASGSWGDWSESTSSLTVGRVRGAWKRFTSGSD